MAKPADVGFVRTATGVRVCLHKATFHLLFSEVERLNNFIASGDERSNRKLREPPGENRNDYLESTRVES